MLIFHPAEIVIVDVVTIWYHSVTHRWFNFNYTINFQTSFSMVILKSVWTE